MRIAWETLSEVDNAGFNIWRSDATDGDYIKLNAALIAAQGGPTLGAAYTFDDADVRAGSTYFYKLEAVDVYGVGTFNGPVSVEVNPLRRLLPARPRLQPGSGLHIRH